MCSSHLIGDVGVLKMCNSVDAASGTCEVKYRNYKHIGLAKRTKSKGAGWHLAPSAFNLVGIAGILDKAFTSSLLSIIGQ